MRTATRVDFQTGQDLHNGARNFVCCGTWGEEPLPVEAERFNFVEQRLVGDAELFGGARLVPAALAQNRFNLEALDVGHGAAHHFFERAFPRKLFADGAVRNLAGRRSLAAAVVGQLVPQVSARLR